MSKIQKLHEEYFKKTTLAMDMVPVVSQYDMFGLKGGTAINMYYRDLPRLSVDLDLAYLPHVPRHVALAEIGKNLSLIAASLPKELKNPNLTWDINDDRHAGTRLWVDDGEVSVKIEVSPVMRESVFPPQYMETTPRAREYFGTKKMLVLPLEDSYAGKVVATLDRQHPRDLFDMMM